MLARFDSRCFICHGQIKAGSDIYYKKGEGTAHWECIEKPEEPGPDTFRLAGELGFVASREVGGESWARICADWAVWNLPAALRCNSTRRVETDSPSRQERTLF